MAEQKASVEDDDLFVGLAIRISCAQVTARANRIVQSQHRDYEKGLAPTSCLLYPPTHEEIAAIVGVLREHLKMLCPATTEIALAASLAEREKGGA